MKKIFLLTVCSILLSCNSNAQKKDKQEEEAFPLTKTDAEWRAQLSEMEYYVLRKNGTEQPGGNEYNKFYEDGVYTCAACGVKIYESKYKYDSGSGWPAFDRGIQENLSFENDLSLGMSRTEVHCANCGGHLGHVFNDGPSKTTGMRHCINSVSLNFIPQENE
jgi:peptide-methionine (R)-S-oxide reductase